MPNEEPPSEFPLLPKLAAGLSVISLLCAAYFAFARPEDGKLGPAICLFVSVLMALMSLRSYRSPRRDQ